MPGSSASAIGISLRAAAVSLLVTAAALAVLARLPPAALRLLPACPFHQATGLLCPGCGSTRAVLALLHGHPVSAWHQNPLLLIALPVLLLYLVAAASGRPLPQPSRPVLALGLAIAAVFGTLRNLPFPL